MSDNLLSWVLVSSARQSQVLCWVCHLKRTQGNSYKWGNCHRRRSCCRSVWLHTVGCCESRRHWSARNGMDAKIWRAGKVTAHDTDREPYPRTLENTARRDRSWVRRHHVTLISHLNGEWWRRWVGSRGTIHCLRTWGCVPIKVLNGFTDYSFY